MFPWKRRKPAKEPAPPPEGGSVPEHLSDLWPILQDIAAQEDPRFREESVAEYSRSRGVEGLKDVDRWLEIYRQRVVPGYRYRFPEHHPRHRGYCLVRRNWPSGATWDAFDEKTLLRLDVPAQPDRESLVRAVDEHLARRDGPSPEG